MTRRYRYSMGPVVCDWIEDNLVLPSGDTQREPFRLLDWQRDYIDELKACDARGRPVFTWSLLGVPKGSGKSPLAAALALNHLFDPDVTDPWVACSAAADKQADIVFEAAKRMCAMSPELAKRTNRYRWEIQLIKGTGKLERVAASGGKLDGKILSFLVIDELHEWLEESWTFLTGGALKRPNSQIIQITTAGWDKETVCYREYSKGLAIEAGKVKNPTYHFKWYSAPDGCDYRDEAMWKKANPSYGTLVRPEIMRDLSINQPELQFRRFRLNQWTESAEAFLPHGAWEACRHPRLAAFEPGKPVWVGWDASTHVDSTAIVAVQAAGDGCYRVKSRAWERPRQPDGNFDETWTVPMGECRAYLDELRTIYGVTSLGYDPTFVTWEAAELEAQGWTVVKYSQTPSRICPITAAFYQAVIERRIYHDGDEVLARHLSNSRPHQTRMGGIMIDKGPKRAPNDAAAALIFGLGEAMVPGQNAWHGIWIPPDEDDD